ncbi:Acetylcholine receptor subunit alpha-type deg-3 [Parelaphostrongylus tenuis]|uniref:Acetylcholine receptor subunit alpha-type deg-3 n=1 Tax=Parelaphostrongylus tenuis TaxID=148309 RepID=A0AAD5QYE7_PARTN|nr:Acetylcholine receptor subunit alpha-type deg-3 [Parelaphostrongylus tenuis]
MTDYLFVIVSLLVVMVTLAEADVVSEILSNSSRKDLAMENTPLVRLTRDLLARDRYDVRVRPIFNHSKSLKVHISISLYQIIEVDEPSQNIKLNVWMIQKWRDEFLSWNPQEYGMINSTIIPFQYLWIPDTYLYNSVKMSRDETERYMNVKIESQYWKGRNGSMMSFLYPAIYTVTCRLNIRYFPYDRQNCTLTISSWTNSKSALDYYSDPEVNLASFIPNEEWDVKSFKIYRHEYKYACCPEPWAILQASLVIQRKPLYYVVNLIIPTSIITVVSITGFFTPASTDDDRTEKINLGITTLLAMSILMLMVSDQMPTTSEFIPLIAWFYLVIIIVVSIGTFLTSVVLSVQCRRQYGQIPPLYIRYYFFVVIPSFVYLSVPEALATLWTELDDDPLNTWRRIRKPSYPPKTACLSKENPNKLPLLERQSVGASLQPGFARSNSIQMIDVSSPSSPAISQRSGAQSTVHSPTHGLWESAVSALTGTNMLLRRTSAAVTREVDELRRKRQCSLEWEFLATVLDRLLLAIFISIVILITAGLVMVGKMAQLSYDNSDESFL